MENSNLISILIVNFNGKHFLKDCFQSIKNQTYKNFEVILVDNNSNDKSIEWVEKSNYNFVKTIKLDKNYGFGIANNEGFKKASGNYILLLNNDTILESDFLENLINPILENDYEIASPLILYKDRPEIIDKAGGHLLYPDGLNRGRGCGMPINQVELNQCEVFYPDGCCALISRKVIEELGFFDEDFYLYGEDTDLGLRYRLSGYKTLFVPSAVLFHVHSGTAGKFSPMKAYYVERNRVFVIIKNFPVLYILISPLFTFIRYFFQGLATLSGHGVSGDFKNENSSFQLIKVLFKANIDSLKMLKVMITKRKKVRKKFKVGFFEFSKLLYKNFLSPIDIAFKD